MEGSEGEEEAGGREGEEEAAGKGEGWTAVGVKWGEECDLVVVARG
jgi:hypothetical protein